MNIKQKSLKINAILNILKTLTSLLFPLVTFPYASRILMPEGLGKVNFAISIVSYFGIIATLGIENYGIREASKVRDDKTRLSQFSKEIFTINMISTLIAYVLLGIAIVAVPKFSDYRILLIVTSSTILFTTLGMNWLFTAVEDFLFITLRFIVFHLISLVMLFVFVKTKEDYVKYAAISVFSNVGANVLNFFYSRKFISLKTGLKMELKKHLKPIFILFAMAVTVQVYSVLDSSMLGFIKGDWAVGIYATASKFNRMVLYLVQAFAPVIYPRLSYYSQQEDKTDFYNLAYKGMRFLFMMAMPCTIGLTILSPQIISIMCGSEFTAAIWPMWILNPIIFVLASSSFIGVQIFMPLNKEKWSLYSSISAAAVNFCLNFLLIPRFGVVGAAFASIIAETVNLIIELVLLRKYMKLLPIFKNFIVYTLNSLIMGVGVFFAIKLVHKDWQQIIVGLAAGVLIYFVLLVLEKDKMLKTLLNGVKNKFFKKQNG